MIGRAIRRLLHIFDVVFYYVTGNIMSWMFYDRKYLNSPYFKAGKLHGIGGIGWRWATFDGASRIFMHANKGVPWPTSSKITVVNPANIEFDPSDLHIFHTFGTYFQAGNGKIKIGKGTWIAPNVGLITSNHDINDLTKHLPGKDIVIGKDSWIGMNAVILPGVVLGDKTIVGAGAVVTKSFPEGHCILVGVPAIIKQRID